MPRWFTAILRTCLELVDIRNELPSYSAVWAVVKIGLLLIPNGCYESL